MNQFDVAVVGGGLAGQIAALAFAGQGFSTVLVAPEDRPDDARTTALMDQSLAFLAQLGLWDKVRPLAAALVTMRIIDGTERLFRAPPASFHASEIGLEAFGYNIPNAPFLKLLSETIAATDGVVRISAFVSEARLAPDGNVLVLDDGQSISARLVVAADGRKSLIRQAASIDVSSHAYPQTAVVFNFAHERPHMNISTEFHTRSGPFTQVPLPGNRSSLVWVVRPELAPELLALDNAVLADRVEAQMQSILGKVTIESRPQAWPLSQITARRFGGGSMVLVGEAAHVFPPIGAQGLNLSLRDVQSALDLAIDARRSGGSFAIGDAYDRKRRADVLTRTSGIDLMNRSLLSDFLPVQLLRAAGLHLLSAVPPLRHLAMQEGVAPGRARTGFPEFLRKKIGGHRA